MTERNGRKPGVQCIKDFKVVPTTDRKRAKPPKAAARRAEGFSRTNIPGTFWGSKAGNLCAQADNWAVFSLIYSDLGALHCDEGNCPREFPTFNY